MQHRTLQYLQRVLVLHTKEQEFILAGQLYSKRVFQPHPYELT